MPIRVPSLDDRSFQDLVDEVLARIPAHTPEWTNPVPGDPGRTLVELFAWLTDTLLYRVNLIPERQRLAFLRLLGMKMRAACAARTVLAINFEAPANALPQYLPATLTRLKGASTFETRGDLTVLPLLGEIYRKRPLTTDESNEMSGKIAQLTRLYPVTGSAVPYLTTPVFPGGQADAAGFDLIQQTVDHSLWYALLVPLEEADDFSPAITAVKANLGPTTEGKPQYLNIGFSPKVAMPAFDDEDIGQRTPIPVSWELAVRAPGSETAVAYLPLTVKEDTTSGLTTDGVVRLVVPPGSSFFAPTNNVRADTDAGTGDKPPRLDDVVKSDRLIGWIRMRPKIDLDSLAIAWTGINGVEVDQRQSTAGLIVGTADGQPDQVLQLPNGGIEEESFSLKVEEAGLGYRRWKRIDDLALAAVQEAVYELDAEAGTVRFGNGVRGRIPARGARFQVEKMRVGGGLAGNLAAGSLTQVQPTGTPVAKLKATQPLAALGGQDAETLGEAEKRIPALFRNRDRAVTADDYKQIAATTPGVRVGRVEVMPLFKPQERRPNVPGVVSVMALPYRASFEAPYPRLDRPFKEAVFNRLADRKPLGTELYVIGCEYVPIAISVGIDNPGGQEETNTAVIEALKKYLYCLAPGGPQGGGWPLGRTVKRRELEIVVSRVDGVDGVYGPNLFQQIGGVWTLVTALGGNDNAELTLLPWQLPELIGVIVGDGEAPAEFKSPAPTKANDGLAIPVVPEVC